MNFDQLVQEPTISIEPFLIGNKLHKMKRTQQLFERIEEYLNETLPQDELESFNNEISVNPQLREEVEKHRDLHRVLSNTDLLDFRKKLQKVSDEIKEEKETFNIKKKRITPFFTNWKVAASIVSIIGIGTLMWNNFIKPSGTIGDLYTENYIPYPVEDVTRGKETARDHWDTVMFHYAKGDYADVVSKLENMGTMSHLEQLKLYLGNSYLNTGRAKEAILQFGTIADTSKYYEDAIWYKALAYLKIGQTTETSQILKEVIKYNGIYKSNAKKLLKELHQ